MTLLDYFAGQALVGLIAKSPFFDREGENGKPMVDMVQFKKDMADSAYWYALAMLEVRDEFLAGAKAPANPGGDHEVAQSNNELSLQAGGSPSGDPSAAFNNGSR